LEEIQSEEHRKKEAEIQKRANARAQFKQYLDENRAFEASKKDREDSQRDVERREMAESRRVMSEREEKARAEMLRKSARGEVQSKKQEIIMERFEQQRLAQEEFERNEAQRLAKVLEERARKEAEEEQRRKARKQQLKSEFTHALDEQLHTLRDQRKHKSQTPEENIFGASSLAVKSDAMRRQREMERKAELQRALEAQIQEKEARERVEFPHKIGSRVTL
jgi:fused signal recognition particle receptor